jgi:hypothetical protein
MVPYEIVLGLLAITGNALGGVLWWMFTKIRKDVDELQKEMATMKFNYLDRFADLKGIIQGFELKVIERITILETLINKKV